MRQLLPTFRNGVDPAEIVGRKYRSVGTSRPWVMANMVMTADGAYSSSGTTRQISGDADREMFHMLRAAADVILVGAGTARTERYRRPTTTANLAPLRVEMGLTLAPRLAVVSTTGSFPPDQPFFSGEGPDPVIFMPENRQPDPPLDSVEVRKIGTTEVEPGAVLESLYDDGARVVLCEGGPHLLGQLASAGLVDELFLTLAPVLVGGSQTGLLGGVEQMHRQMRIHHLIEGDDHLMLSYRPVENPAD